MKLWHTRGHGTVPEPVIQTTFSDFIVPRTSERGEGEEGGNKPWKLEKCKFLRSAIKKKSLGLFRFSRYKYECCWHLPLWDVPAFEPFFAGMNLRWHEASQNPKREEKDKIDNLAPFWVSN